MHPIGPVEDHRRICQQLHLPTLGYSAVFSSALQWTIVEYEALVEFRKTIRGYLASVQQLGATANSTAVGEAVCAVNKLAVQALGLSTAAQHSRPRD